MELPEQFTSEIITEGSNTVFSGFFSALQHYKCPHMISSRVNCVEVECAVS